MTELKIKKIIRLTSLFAFIGWFASGVYLRTPAAKLFLEIAHGIASFALGMSIGIAVIAFAAWAASNDDWFSDTGE